MGGQRGSYRRKGRERNEREGGGQGVGVSCTQRYCDDESISAQTDTNLAQGSKVTLKPEPNPVVFCSVL